MSSRPRILLMGPRRSGKSSIQRVVFQKLSPHETLFLESTNSLEANEIKSNPFVQFDVLDFPGDLDVHEELMCDGEAKDLSTFFTGCIALIYVLDAQDELCSEALSKLNEILRYATEINPHLFCEVFIHKVDGDLFLSEDLKIDCQRDIQQQVNLELDSDLDIQFSFYLTSIYDHSIFEAFSKVVQKVIPQLPGIENLLNILIAECEIEKAFLFDVFSKIYVATDHNPVDIQSYELCSDMIDVVIDVSCIYGMGDEVKDELAYDKCSCSSIRLNNNMVLYLRQVASYLALVCLVRSPNFERQGLIDYNIDCFKASLAEVFKEKDDTEVSDAATSETGATSPRSSNVPSPNVSSAAASSSIS